MNKIQIKQLIGKVKDFIINDIWKLEANSLPKYYKVLVKGLRTLTLAFRGFKEDEVSLRASALTFYSVLSVVPVMAMAFGISKGFGFDGKLQELLKESLEGQEDVANFLIDFSNNMLNSVQGGWIFGIGLVFLIWSVLQVLGNIENAFNNIWQVKRSRGFFRKFSDYISIMLIAPIIIILSSSTQVLIIEMIDTATSDIAIIGYFGSVIYTLVKFIPYILIWLLFTFIYMVMPNTKVKFGSALIAGMVAGTIFQLLQWGYIHFQIGVSKYNIVYGSFAALPLFLVWLNWSWLIILFGAEISFSAQNHHQYEYESDIKNMSSKSMNLITLYITHHVIINFEQNSGHLTAQNISEQLKLPVKLVRHILYELVECRVFAETPSANSKEPAFLPARDIKNLTVLEVTDSLSKKGSEYSFIDSDIDALNSITELLNNANNEFAKANYNMAIKDI